MEKVEAGVQDCGGVIFKGDCTYGADLSNLVGRKGDWQEHEIQFRRGEGRNINLVRHLKSRSHWKRRRGWQPLNPRCCVEGLLQLDNSVQIQVCWVQQVTKPKRGEHVPGTANNRQSYTTTYTVLHTHYKCSPLVTPAPVVRIVVVHRGHPQQIPVWKKNSVEPIKI